MIIGCLSVKSVDVSTKTEAQHYTSTFHFTSIVLGDTTDYIYNNISYLISHCFEICLSCSELVPTLFHEMRKRNATKNVQKTTQGFHKFSNIHVRNTNICH